LASLIGTNQKEATSSKGNHRRVASIEGSAVEDVGHHGTESKLDGKMSIRCPGGAQNCPEAQPVLRTGR
jgi:hypothetical protein